MYMVYMFNYGYIVNPITNRKISVYTKTGKNIINNFIRANYTTRQFAGSSLSQFETLKLEASRRSQAPVPSRSQILRKKTKERLYSPVTIPYKKPTIAYSIKQKNIAKRGCVKITLDNSTPSEFNKYNTRPSPPFPANECPTGIKKKGRDGIMWEVSEPDKRGTKKWVKVKNK